MKLQDHTGNQSINQCMPIYILPNMCMCACVSACVYLDYKVFWAEETQTKRHPQTLSRIHEGPPSACNMTHVRHHLPENASLWSSQRRGQQHQENKDRTKEGASLGRSGQTALAHYQEKARPARACTRSVRGSITAYATKQYLTRNKTRWKMTHQVIATCRKYKFRIR